MLRSPDQGCPSSSTEVQASTHWVFTQVRLAAIAAQLALAALAVVLIAVTVLGGLRFERTRTNHAWLREIKASYQWEHQGVDLRHVGWKQVQAWLAPALGANLVSDISTIKIVRGSLNDAQLERLALFPNVQTVILSSNAATDATLRRLSQRRGVSSLALDGSQFTFTGLLELRKLPKLQSLVLSGMQLNSAEIAVLEAALPLVNLEYNSGQQSESYSRHVASRFPMHGFKRQSSIDVKFESLQWKSGNPGDEVASPATISDDDIITRSATAAGQT